MFCKRITAVVLLSVTGLALWLVGDYMQRVHGFDPPYGYFFAGFGFVLLGSLCEFIAASLFIFTAFQKITGQRKKLL